ncbi:MAG: acylphosphatase [Rhodospirillaceae bacterium]|nr:acylphosphatase [Rhodospirillaceae bacterium]
MKIVRAVISGKVQGVWFRAWTIEEAAKRDLRGWVRNRKDGSVEALFAGDPARVDAMLAACRKGPPLAKVENVESHEADGEKIPDGFDQRRTA